MKTILPFFLLLLLATSCETTPETPQIGANIRTNVSQQKKIINKEKVIVPFVSKEGRFSILFPEKPIKDVHTTSAEIGEIKLTQFIYNKDETNIWLVSYSDYPKKMIHLGNNNQLLKGIKHRILKEFRAQPSLEKEVTLADKHQGLSFSAHSNKNSLDVLYQIYLVENRVYQISMYSSVGKFPTQDSSDFMGSFKLWTEIDSIEQSPS
jgi:hypothetical protein